MKNLFLTVFSLLFIAFLSEVVLREFYTPLNSGWGWNDSPRRSLADFGNDFPNQIGVRGQQIAYNEDDYVIVLLGDSQVESATCSPVVMPEILLEKSLNNFSDRNVKVFSIAASGWGQDQQLLALETYYKKYRADLILIWITPKNDFWENAFPDRSVTKTAGHLKPTFRLIDNKLSNSYLTPNTYYKNSVLFQLFVSAWQTLNEETIEQFVLDEWINYLPSPHSNSNGLFRENITYSSKIDLNEFSQNVFDYSKYDDVTILTYEDFKNSRSHFSPYLVKKSDRDTYLINISKYLFKKIFSVAKANDSKVLVFYPIREDFDDIYKNSIKYVENYQNPGLLFSVNLDYLSIIKEVIPEKFLFYFSIKGENNICVDIKDRHFNLKGNKEVIQNVSNYILENFFKKKKYYIK